MKFQDEEKSSRNFYRDFYRSFTAVYEIPVFNSIDFSIDYNERFEEEGMKRCMFYWSVPNWSEKDKSYLIFDLPTTKAFHSTFKIFYK